MQRSVTRLIVALAIVAVLSGGTGAGPAVALAGAPPAQAACVEPNDQFQAACDLPTDQDVTGTIGSADDVDAFHFLVLDFDSTAKVTLTDLPAPYEAYIADWRGELIASSVAAGNGQMAQAALKMPGVYYVFVRSGTGQFSAGEPYHLTASVSYGSRTPRRLVWQQSLDSIDAVTRSEDGKVDHILANGKITMVLKEAGTTNEPVTGRLRIQETMKPGFGPEFGLVTDIRQPAGANAGFWVSFGTNFESAVSYHRVVVDVERNEAWLTRYTDDKSERIVPTKKINAADQQGGVNRLAVYATASEIHVSLNGQDIIQVAGQQVTPGTVAFGTISWGEPISTLFDNFALTTRG